jgi:hypothetical protein
MNNFIISIINIKSINGRIKTDIAGKLLYIIFDYKKLYLKIRQMSDVDFENELEGAFTKEFGEDNMPHSPLVKITLTDNKLYTIRSNFKVHKGSIIAKICGGDCFVVDRDRKTIKEFNKDLILYDIEDGETLVANRNWSILVMTPKKGTIIEIDDDIDIQPTSELIKAGHMDTFLMHLEGYQKRRSGAGKRSKKSGKKSSARSKKY